MHFINLVTWVTAIGLNSQFYLIAKLVRGFRSAHKHTGMIAAFGAFPMKFPMKFPVPQKPSG
jgi:hypothetical protein